MSGYIEFEFNLPDALLLDLVKVFNLLESASLTTNNLLSVPDAQGVYQLFYKGKLVYIGKTDAESGLKKRLDRHASSILHRKNLNPDEVAFKAVRIFVFTAIDLETQLLQYNGGVREVAWNGSGFGANDPGRKRDHTKVKPGSFDAQFPIDIDLVANYRPSSYSAASILSTVKQTVPYVFRFELSATGRQPHEELVNTEISNLPNEVTTAREVICHVLAHLPSGWQATKLPGRVIIYRETVAYEHGEVIART